MNKAMAARRAHWLVGRWVEATIGEGVEFQCPTCGDRTEPDCADCTRVADALDLIVRRHHDASRLDYTTGEPPLEVLS